MSIKMLNTACVGCNWDQHGNSDMHKSLTTDKILDIGAKINIIPYNCYDLTQYSVPYRFHKVVIIYILART